MRYRRTFSALLAALSLGTCASCDRGRDPGSAGTNAHAPRSGHAGVTATDAKDAFHPVTGETIYVPVYSQVAAGDRGHLLDLAVTLSIRNTDRSGPIVVRSVRYFDRSGRLLKEYVKAPVRIAPMAAAEYFVNARDTTGGTAASFLIDWSAEQNVSSPLVEAVMVGSASNLAVSFTTAGRVVGKTGDGN